MWHYYWLHGYKFVQNKTLVGIRNMCDVRIIKWVSIARHPLKQV